MDHDQKSISKLWLGFSVCACFCSLWGGGESSRFPFLSKIDFSTQSGWSGVVAVRPVELVALGERRKKKKSKWYQFVKGGWSLCVCGWLFFPFWLFLPKKKLLHTWPLSQIELLTKGIVFPRLVKQISPEMFQAFIRSHFRPIKHF